MNRFIRNLIFATALLFSSSLYAQQKQYKVLNIGFYNLENLFDTIHQKGVNDYEYLPESKKKYNSFVYNDKLNKLSSVIVEVGKNVSPDGVAILGVCEIENRTVLEDLVKTEALKNRNYQIVHYDSPDRRGVDVGFLYNPKYFTVDTSYNFPVDFPPAADGYKSYTRDVLWVKGRLDGETYHFFVNHWPSRYGGPAASNHRRVKAAEVCRAVIDSIYNVEPQANIVVMGDFNDNPTDASITKSLKANHKLTDADEQVLYNPWVDSYQKGIGTIAYQDSWSLFDQIIISRNVLKKSDDKYSFYKSGIYKRDDMIQTTGRYKGYPKRTFDFDRYVGGFSDHFPTYITLIKPF